MKIIKCLSENICGMDSITQEVIDFLKPNEWVQIGPQLPSFSNFNFKVTTSNGNFVLKIPSAVSREISNQQEHEILQWARTHKFTRLEIEKYDPKNGFMLSKFLEGHFCRASDFENLTLVEKAMALLKELHNLEKSPLSTDFNPMHRFRVTSKEVWSEELCEVGTKLEKLWNETPKTIFSIKPCHNDPSPENFYYSEDELTLNDWELASNNDPMWDLAHFSVIANVETSLLLKLYKSEDDFAEAKITYFKPFVYFQSLLWAAGEKQKKSSNKQIETIKNLYSTFLEKMNSILESQKFKKSYQTFKRSDDNEF